MGHGFGEYIRRARKQKGWTQEELAEALHVKRPVISKYENGIIEPTVSRFKEIAQALDVKDWTQIATGKATIKKEDAMNIRTIQQMNADICDENGNQKVMLHASYGARSLNLTVEVLDPSYVQAHTANVEQDAAQFVALACEEAAKAGLPTSRITHDV